MPSKTKLSHRKVDLANHQSATKSEPLDTANIVIDKKKLEDLSKALPKIRKIKKEKVEKVEVASSVTTTSVPGEKAPSLEELTINPDEFLHLDENAENQVVQC